MPENQLKAFLEAAKGNVSIEGKLAAAQDSGEVLKIAKEAGFEISANDLVSVQEDVSEEELQSVTGGGLDPQAVVKRGIYDLAKLSARFK